MTELAAAPAESAEIVFLGLRKAAPHGEIARVLLAFLASAGLFYVNIMPALVDGLVQGAGFTNRQAGLVGSSNVYGAALGALVAVFFVKRIDWRKAAYALLAGLICIDLSSLLLQKFAPAARHAFRARLRRRHARRHRVLDHCPYARSPIARSVTCCWCSLVSADLGSCCCHHWCRSSARACCSGR